MACVYHGRRWLWVHACAGTTEKCGAGSYALKIVSPNISSTRKITTNT